MTAVKHAALGVVGAFTLGALVVLHIIGSRINRALNNTDYDD